MKTQLIIYIYQRQSIDHYLYRLLLTALVVAIKFFDDIFYMNKVYAKIGGISAEEMSFLETSFLRMIGFDLWVSEECYKRCWRDMNKNYK